MTTAENIKFMLLLREILDVKPKLLNFSALFPETDPARSGLYTTIRSCARNLKRLERYAHDPKRQARIIERNTFDPKMLRELQQRLRPVKLLLDVLFEATNESKAGAEN